MDAEYFSFRFWPKNGGLVRLVSHPHVSIGIYPQPGFILQSGHNPVILEVTIALPDHRGKMHPTQAKVLEKEMVRVLQRQPDLIHPDLYYSESLTRFDKPSWTYALVITHQGRQVWHRDACPILSELFDIARTVATWIEKYNEYVLSPLAVAV
jgi:hypothetical protein